MSVPYLLFEVEKFFTKLRKTLLLQATSPDISEEIFPIQISLALHCFVNEYLFYESEAETELLLILEEKLKRQSENADAVNWFNVVTLASYRPLGNYDSIAMLTCPAPIQPIYTAHIDNMAEEMELRKSIPILNPIENETSIKVRQQYEENPYPRWINTRFEIRPRTISEIVEDSRLRISLEDIPSSSAPEVLVAGCGTGQHPLYTASKILDCKVLAVDLSLSSLAYAKRKTIELEILNVDYMQADLLELAMLGKQFDIVESVGVLHHLGDPVAGWRVLKECLKSSIL